MYSHRMMTLHATATAHTARQTAFTAGREERPFAKAPKEAVLSPKEKLIMLADVVGREAA
jgi:hypothetical protein